MDKRETLQTLTFGNQVAEEERDILRDYFVKTQAWNRIFNGEIDIIYGPKGAGKSALYVLIQDHIDDLARRRIILIAAENPRGAPAFKSLVHEPPTSEREFIGIWKLYLVSLVARSLQSFSVDNKFARELYQILSENSLLATNASSLGSILRSVRAYVSRKLLAVGVETNVQFDPATGAPIFSGKIVFDEPDIAEQARGYLSVDDLLAKASDALNAAGLQTWITLDRLDVAFDESTVLERNALRALLRVYRDLRSYDTIRLKIFLRTDIWKRITEEGFREATHMSREHHIRWPKQALQNLILRRLLSNAAIISFYGIDKDKVLASSDKQDQLFSQIFPDQVEVGENQSTTIDWLLKRTADGSKESQPRDIILFLNTRVEVQNQRLERGEAEPTGPQLFERSSFKEALPALSEYRISRVLFAEYPELRPFIDSMREQKTEHNSESLSRLWGKSPGEALTIARKLRDIGFFEERASRTSPTFWVPFLYRPYLSLVQGKAEDVATQSAAARSDALEDD